MTVDLPSLEPVEAIQIIPVAQSEPIKLRFDLIGCLMGKRNVDLIIL